MQSRRPQSYSRQVAVSHLAVPSRLQVTSQSYFSPVTFLYVTDSGDYPFRRWSWQSNILNHFMHYTSYVVRLRYDQSTYNIRLHCGLIK